MVLLFGVLVGAGLLRTEVWATDTVVARVDAAVIGWFAGVRDPALTPLMAWASALGSTGVIVGSAVGAAAASLAVTRRWRLVLFLAAVMLGEVTLFLAVTHLIGRPRPLVPHLGPDPPPTSSFPSGHVAAALALYGAVGLLVTARTRSAGRRWWWAGGVAAGWAVLGPVLVAAARMYRGVHFPTDVAGSVLLALPWLALCWQMLRPAPDRPPRGRIGPAAPQDSGASAGPPAAGAAG